MSEIEVTESSQKCARGDQTGHWESIMSLPIEG